MERQELKRPLLEVVGDPGVAGRPAGLMIGAVAAEGASRQSEARPQGGGGQVQERDSRGESRATET
jgi:hypothetical protein